MDRFVFHVVTWLGSFTLRQEVFFFGSALSFFGNTLVFYQRSYIYEDLMISFGSSKRILVYYLEISHQHSFVQTNLKLPS
jgi:hypothetical protein